MKRLVILFLGTPLLAHERLFLYTYDTDLLPPSFTEFEVWLTIKRGKEGMLYSAQDIRLEVEHAFTPNLSTDIYFDFGRTFEAKSDGKGNDVTKFKGLAWAWIYRIPPFGFYFELYNYVNEIKPEIKLLFSKNLGDFQIASNLSYEIEYKFKDYYTTLEKSEIYISGGIAKKFSLNDRSLSLALEGWTHSEWEDRILLRSDAKHHALFIGPVIHYSSAKFWISLGVYPQITRTDRESVNSRIILGTIF